MAKRAYGHLKAGSINGLSVGFITEQEQYDEARDVRVITKVNLLEVSLVTFPANQSATITTVRAALSNGDIPPPKHVEKVLREAGFSRTQAKTIMAKGYSALTPRDAEERAAINEISELVNKWSFNNESRISKRSNQHSI